MPFDYMHPRNKREERQERAKARLQARAVRTPREQIAHLDELLGEGVGAVKERARLLKTASKSTLTPTKRKRVRKH